METIYAVTASGYDEHSIIGLCSTEEAANVLAKHLRENPTHYGNYSIHVEPYIIDQLVPFAEQGLLHFRVDMYIDGNCRISATSIVDEHCYMDVDWYGRPCLTAYVLATDEQHAKQIANEKRVQLIASGEWEV